MYCTLQVPKILPHALLVLKNRAGIANPGLRTK